MNEPIGRLFILQTLHYCVLQHPHTACNSFILTHYSVDASSSSMMKQFFAFALHHFRHRNSCPACNNFGNIFSINFFLNQMFRRTFEFPVRLSDDQFRASASFILPYLKFCHTPDNFTCTFGCHRLPTCHRFNFQFVFLNGINYSDFSELPLEP
jgi:hypothetical protein